MTEVVLYLRKDCIACRRVVYMLDSSGISYRTEERQYGTVPEIHCRGKVYRSPITYDDLREISLTKVKRIPR